MNFGALHLEAAYQLMRGRGYKGTRRAFMRYGFNLVSQMRLRGEL